MVLLVVALVVGAVLLVISTDQFVTGASRVAGGLRMSSVLVGAVILGCGTGLPELALAFQGGHRTSPLRVLLGANESQGAGTALVVFVVILAGVLAFPTIFPDRIRRHSPLMVMATIAFAALLRGSLDRIEGSAMLLGFVVGIAWVLNAGRDATVDPFAPLIDDDYDSHGAYIEAPVMTPVQVEATRSMAGLLGTAVGAQVLAYAAEGILRDQGFGENAQNLVLIALGSVLPHVVVALQAMRQHHESLAVGNLIGSNLFHSLVIGGLVAIVKPYESGGALSLSTIGVIATTAAITYLLLHGDDEMTRPQGLALLGAYIGLVVITIS